MYLIGYDIGTSGVKATMMDAQNGQVVASATCPDKEMDIISHQSGWAEQNPQDWWLNVKQATHRMLGNCEVSPNDIQAIGITYQMHGLVCVDKDYQVLRPSIIWCDSRAVKIGDKAAEDLGKQRCLERLLNYPGNFTATKLKWVMENQPDVYDKIHKVMLPGDYIAMKMTDVATTTQSGLSEGILWDFKESRIAGFAMEYFGFSNDIIPDIVPTFGLQGQLTKQGAKELSLTAGTKVCYRAGDQPNNALSLNVLQPGQIATTAGTSGVVYGINEKKNYDAKSRVNTFLHVNNTNDKPRYGVLLCINGTGILNSWLKHNITGGKDYDQMNALASKAPIGSDSLSILPFGNGAERTLENKDIGASIHGLNFNIHGIAHVLRAGQEGIVFALNYGLGIMEEMAIEVDTVRAGYANMFLSPLFASAFATVTNSVVELYNTDGSQGAARGAGIGAGIYKTEDQAFVGLKKIKTVEPDKGSTGAYADAYRRWLKVLQEKLNAT